MKIATNIKTSVWRSIVHHLYTNGWEVKEKYVGYDASIDVDFIVLYKDGETIYFGWELLDRGEIKCSDDQFQKLESLIGSKFEFGKPMTLNFKILATLRPLSFHTRLISNKDKLMKDYFYMD